MGFRPLQAAGLPFASVPRMKTKSLVTAALTIGLAGCALNFGGTGRAQVSHETLARVAPGSTPEQVVALLGQPAQTYRTRTGFEEWDYPVEVDMRLYDFLVDFDGERRVAQAWLLHDPIYDAPGGFP